MSRAYMGELIAMSGVQYEDSGPGAPCASKPGVGVGLALCTTSRVTVRHRTRQDHSGHLDVDLSKQVARDRLKCTQCLCTDSTAGNLVHYVDENGRARCVSSIDVDDHGRAKEEAQTM